MPPAGEDLATSGAARPPLLPLDPAQFQRRLTVVTLGLLLVVLLGFVLYVCASILQPSLARGKPPVEQLGVPDAQGQAVRLLVGAGGLDPGGVGGVQGDGQR